MRCAFRASGPARASRKEGGEPLPLPNIRLDRAIEFLIGDRLA